MANVIASDLEKARILVLDMKCSLLAAMDGASDADMIKLSSAYDSLSDAYDSLCDATDTLKD